MVDMNVIVQNALPIIKTIVYGVVLLTIVASASYYFFIVRKRRNILCTIWEEDAGHNFKATRKDTLIRKKTNKGKELYYMFKFARIETIPPLPEHIIRFGKREEAHYLKTDDDTFIPCKIIFEGNNIRFIPMDYDVNILRIQAIDRREKIYQEKLGWLKEHQALIASVLIIGLLMVVIYLTFDWLTGVVNTVMGRVDKTATLLERIVNT